MSEEDLDPKLLLWAMHRNVDHDKVPPGRTVIRFQFAGVPASARDWWLVITPDDADVCDSDPGYPVAVTVSGSLRCLTRVWRGDLTWNAALASGDVRIAARRTCGERSGGGSPCQCSRQCPGQPSQLHPDSVLGVSL